MKLIQEHIEAIRKLCQNYHVAELYVFGSVLTDRFSSVSDIDFLVRFSGVDPLEYFDNFMDLKEGLETLLSRKVDLVEVQTLKNPILILNGQLNEKKSYYMDERILKWLYDIEGAIDEIESYYSYSESPGAGRSKRTLREKQSYHKSGGKLWVSCFTFVMKSFMVA